MGEQMLDELDKKIIKELRLSSKGSYRRLAKRIGIHPSTLIQRVKRLEKEGIILGYSANIDYLKMGYEFMAVIQVRISKGSLLAVQNKISKLPGVIEIYDVTGECDSIVLVACKNRGEFSRLVKRILSIENVERTNTHVILNVVKDGHTFILE